MVTQYNEDFKDKSLAKKGIDKHIAKENEIKFAEKKEELSKMLKGKLQDADSSISDDERYLLDEIRDTINKQYQYNESSIPFEIFQNADDALKQLPEDKRNKKSFVLEEENKQIQFLHWGRPVNSWAGTDLSRAKARKREV